MGTFHQVLSCQTNPAPGGVFLGQVFSSTGGQSSSTTGTWGAATTAGSTLVVGVTVDGGESVVAPTGWQLLCVDAVGPTVKRWLFAQAAAPSQTSTPVFQLSGTASWTMCGVEVIGAQHASYDQVAVASGTGTAVSVGPTGPTNTPAELATLFVSVDTLPQGYAGGFTNGYSLQSNSSFVGTNQAVATKQLSTVGATTGGTTLDNSGDWSARLLTWW